MSKANNLIVTYEMFNELLREVDAKQDPNAQGKYDII